MSEVVINLVKIYVDCSGEKMLTEVQKRCNGILEVDDKSDKTPHLVIVLEEINLIMRKRIMKNLLTRLQPLLNSK